VSALIVITLTLVLAGAVAVVCTDDPERQAVTLSVYGLLMAVLFFLLAAPDVALSQIVVGTAIVPLMVMLTIRKIRGSGE
jgi:energy-converting hydrogenase B subunit D